MLLGYLFEEPNLGVSAAPRFLVLARIVDTRTDCTSALLPEAPSRRESAVLVPGFCLLTTNWPAPGSSGAGRFSADIAAGLDINLNRYNFLLFVICGAKFGGYYKTCKVVARDFARLCSVAKLKLRLSRTRSSKYLSTK